MQNNNFASAPMRIALCNRTGTVVLRTYQLGGEANNTPIVAPFSSDASNNRPALVGGYEYDSEPDVDDFEQLLKDSNARKTNAPKAAAVSTTHSKLLTFPEDNIYDLKCKIQLITGIPTYRQYLFWAPNAADVDGYVTSFDIMVDGVPYPTDYYDMVTTSPPRAGIELDRGLPIDKQLYHVRETMKVYAKDCSMALGAVFADPQNRTVYVIDINTVLEPVRMSIISRLKDKYDTDLFYYGFVIKYWPMITRAVLYDYLVNETELKDKYPDLALSSSTLEAQLRAESALMSDRYKHIKRVKPLGTAITRAIICTQNDDVVINTRTLFDVLATSSTITEMRLYYGKYLCRKFRLGSTETLFPATPLLKSGLLLRVECDANAGLYDVFVNIKENGAVYVSLHAKDDYGFDFDTLSLAASDIVNPIVGFINEHARALISRGVKLRTLNEINAQYLSVDACVYWKESISMSAYKMVKNAWDPYLKAKIVSIKGIYQFEKYELSFRKGMNEFSSEDVEKAFVASGADYGGNQYSYLTDSTVRQKWMQNYDGKTMHMILRTTDIKFEISNIHQNEFHLFKQYIEHFAHTVASSPEFKSTAQTKQSSSTHRLRKLQEEDPELYDLRRHGSPKLYSRLCQGPHQPLILSEKEFNALPPKAQKRIYHYWNFTTQKRAYYQCPSQTHPYLDFIVGKHPEGFCLPCCGKRDTSAGDLYSSCVSSHEYQHKSDELSLHILGYAKNLTVGRLSRLPKPLHDLFTSHSAPKTGAYRPRKPEAPLDDGRRKSRPHNVDFYIFGVTQHVAGVELGALEAICEILGVTPLDFLTRILAHIDDGSLRFTNKHETIFGDKTTMRDFVMSVLSLYGGHKEPSVVDDVLNISRFGSWPEFVFGVSSRLYSVGVVVMIDKGYVASRADFDVLAGPDTKENILHGENVCFIVKRGNEFYPIEHIDTAAYFNDPTNKKSRQKIFGTSSGTKSIQFLCSALSSVEQSRVVTTYHIQKFLSDTSYGNITGQYLDQDGHVYGLQISTGIYVPVHVNFALPGVTTMRSLDRTGSGQKLLEFIEAYNAWSNDAPKMIVDKHLTNGAGETIGLMINGMIAYCDGPVSAPESKKMLYDYRAVDDAIINTAEPVMPRDYKKLAFKGLYASNVYRLFVLAFSAHVRSKTNDKVRRAIIDYVSNEKIKSAPALSAGLGAMITALAKAGLEVGPKDAKKIMRRAEEWKSAQGSLVDYVLDDRFEFDDSYLHELCASEKEAIYNELTKIGPTLAVERAVDMPADIEFPNILVTCDCAAGSSCPAYCCDKKLVVDPALITIDAMCKALSAELSNPIISKYILITAWQHNFVNTLSFTRRQGERISFYLLR